MRIAIVLPDLRSGGAERMRLMLAQEWLARGFDVDFVVLRREGELLQLIPPDARIIDLGVARFRDALLPLRAYIRRQRPSIVLAAMWPLTVVAIIAAKLSCISIRVLVSDHSILSKSYQHKGVLHRTLMRASMALAYRLADVRIAVSNGVAVDASALSGIPIDCFLVIYNPAASNIVPASPLAVPPELAGVHGPLILSVGTLKKVKDFPLLIRAFSKLASRSEATLCILGEGVLRIELEQVVIRCGLEGRVLLPGYRRDTASWYARANLFVMSSRHEGFGNVIVEALEHGVPVVSTDCTSGPREILCDGKFGRLVPVGDADGLAAAMEETLAKSPDQKMLKARARDFSATRIAEEYLDVMFPEMRQLSNK